MLAPTATADSRRRHSRSLTVDVCHICYQPSAFPLLGDLPGRSPTMAVRDDRMQRGDELAALRGEVVVDGHGGRATVRDTSPACSSSFRRSESMRPERPSTIASISPTGWRRVRGQAESRCSSGVRRVRSSRRLCGIAGRWPQRGYAGAGRAGRGPDARAVVGAIVVADRRAGTARHPAARPPLRHLGNVVAGSSRPRVRSA